MYQNYLEINLKDGWYASVVAFDKPRQSNYEPSRFHMGSVDVQHDQYETTFHMEMWMYDYDRQSNQYRIYVDTCAKDFEGVIIDDTLVSRNFFIHGPCSDEFLCESLARQWEAQHADWIAGANAIRLAEPFWESERKTG